MEGDVIREARINKTAFRLSVDYIPHDQLDDIMDIRIRHIGEVGDEMEVGKLIQTAQFNMLNKVAFDEIMKYLAYRLKNHIYGEKK